MKPRTLISVVAIAALTALTPSRGLAAQQEWESKAAKLPHYKLTVLPTLGGTFGEAIGVNNKGSVAGFSTPPGDMVVYPFIWTNGLITDLGTLGGPVSITGENPRVINDNDTVIGLSNTSTPDPNGEDVCGFGTSLISGHLRCRAGENVTAGPLGFAQGKLFDSDAHLCADPRSG